MHELNTLLKTFQKNPMKKLDEINQYLRNLLILLVLLTILIKINNTKNFFFFAFGLIQLFDDSAVCSGVLKFHITVFLRYKQFHESVAG